jgi:predicted nucleic acid-binding protein
MTSVFLDTVGLIALWDSSDQWHMPATLAYEKLMSTGRKIVTTHYVMLECGNASARRMYRNDVYELRAVLASEGLVFDPTLQEIESAWDAYRWATSGPAGIVDYISFEVMRRLGIREAFTNDRHFEAAGFICLF